MVLKGVRTRINIGCARHDPPNCAARTNLANQPSVDLMNSFGYCHRNTKHTDYTPDEVGKLAGDVSDLELDIYAFFQKQLSH